MPLEDQHSVQVSGDIRDRDGKLLFRLNTENLRQLEQIAHKGVSDVSGHGREIGGLVIGTMPTAVDSVVTIVDFVRVAIKYRFGPGYKLCDADEMAFKEALVGFYPGRGSDVIGYFRSHIGTATDVRMEDRLLLRHLFGDRPCLLILILAGKFRPGILHFHLKKAGGELEPIYKVPVSELLGAPLPTDEPDVLLTGPSGPLQTGAASLQDQHPASKKRLVLILGTLIVALTTFSIGRLTVGARNSPAVPVGLSVGKRGAKFEVRWNAASPTVRNATGGSLIIVANAETQHVELSAADLRTGRYEFTPARSGLVLQIILRQRHNTFAGETLSSHVDIPEPPVEAPEAPNPEKPLLARTIAEMRVVIPSVKAQTRPPGSKAKRTAFVAPPIQPAETPAIGIDQPPSLVVAAPPSSQSGVARLVPPIAAKPPKSSAGAARYLIPPGVRTLIRWAKGKDPPKE
jgi:hypothetical protein